MLQRFIDVCQAMQYAHDRGVPHRDLKPGNIMLGQYGETLVVDWGLAKPLGEWRGVPESHDKPVVPRTPLSGSDVAGTLAGSAIGTPQYMSPEQAEGRVDELGPATDVYALGATLYHVLTGKPPAAGGNIVEVLDNVRRGQLVPPRERVAAIPRPLEAICRKALSLQPTDRYAQTRQLADEIRSWLADEPVQAYPESWGARTARWFRRHRGVALTLSIAAPVLLSTMGIASYLIGAAEQAAAQAHFRETQALALTTHVTAFETALEKADWDEAHWRRLDDTVAQLQSLEPERARQARERMVQRYAALLNERLQRPRLTDADVRAFEADLARLEPRDAAARLKQTLAARLNSWEPVAELQGDFSEWDRIFSTANVGLEQGRLVRKPAVVSEAPSPTMPPDRVPTSLAATGDVQCEATFDGTALETGVLGIEFLASEVSGYSFLLIPVPPTDVPGNDEGHEEERASRLVIQRDGQTLRETRLLQRELAKETLVLHVLRQGERLQVQVNDRLPMELLDPFPLPTSPPGLVALRWGPESGRVLRLVVSRWRQPSAPSPLEVADRLYAAGEFRDALRKYDEQAQQSQGSEFAREARYKQGVCLQELGRIDDARQIYERLSSEEADRWSTLADFQLWARAVETNEADLSEAIYLRLSQKYSFEDLARIAPDGIRKRITEFGKFETSVYERYLLYDPNRLSKSQRAFDVLGLLDPGSLAYHTAAECLIKDAAVLGRFDLALQVLRQKIPYIEASWFDDILLDVLSSSGQSLAALDEVEKLARSPRFRGRYWDCHFAVHRAQCLERIS